MGIGRSIKNVATIKGMTLKELADESGVSYRAITSIVARDSEKINIENFNKITKALGMEGASYDDINKFSKIYYLSDAPANQLYPTIFRSVYSNGGFIMNDEEYYSIMLGEGRGHLYLNNDMMNSLEKELIDSNFKSILDKAKIDK